MPVRSGVYTYSPASISTLTSKPTNSSTSSSKYSSILPTNSSLSYGQYKPLASPTTTNGTTTSTTSTSRSSFRSSPSRYGSGGTTTTTTTADTLSPTTTTTSGGAGRSFGRYNWSSASSYSPSSSYLSSSSSLNSSTSSSAGAANSSYSSSVGHYKPISGSGSGSGTGSSNSQSTKTHNSSFSSPSRYNTIGLATAATSSTSSSSSSPASQRCSLSASSNSSLSSSGGDHFHSNYSSARQYNRSPASSSSNNSLSSSAYSSGGAGSGSGSSSIGSSNTTYTSSSNYVPKSRRLSHTSYQSRESLVSSLSSYRQTPSVTGCSCSSAAGRQRASPPTPPPQAALAAQAVPSASAPSSLPADVPSGLVNLGNTCYMNASLQALYSIEALRNQIISSSCDIGGAGSTTSSLYGSSSNISACSGSVSSMAMGNKVLTRQLGDLFKKMKESSSLAAAAAAASSSPSSSSSLSSSSYRYSTSATTRGAPPVTPDRFKFAFAQYQNKFSGFGQQDAQEFLRYLINGVHEEFNLAPKRQRRGATTSRPAPKTSQEAWSQYRDIVDDSPLVDLLVGQLCSTITCGQCQNKSHCWDPFWDLSLPLAMRKHGTSNTASLASARTTTSAASSTLASSCGSGSGSGGFYTSGARYTYGTVSCSLLDVINEFTSIETLDSDERPICSACKKATPATKQISLARLPQVLILHLKKFTNDGYKLTSPDITIDKQLTFNGVRYKLKACIEHHGHSSASGHYTSHCQYSTRWFHFNDGSVSDVTSSFESKKLDDAYVLFYTQTDSSSSSCSISQSKL